MKSNEFITEAPRMDPSGPAKWVQLIKRDCQPYLKEMKGKPFTKFPLYRGITEGATLASASTDEFMKKAVRLDDRTPTDTKQSLHDMTNIYFQDNYGAPFRNAMFCTGSIGETERYGSPYVIFPIGEFQYVWSFKIDDLYPKVHHASRRNESFGQHELNELLDFGNYQTTRLSSAAQSGHEIMIRCKEYYAINLNSVKGMEAEMEKYLK